MLHNIQISYHKIEKFRSRSVEAGRPYLNHLIDLLGEGGLAAQQHLAVTGDEARGCQRVAGRVVGMLQLTVGVNHQHAMVDLVHHSQQHARIDAAA